MQKQVFESGSAEEFEIRSVDGLFVRVSRFSRPSWTGPWDVAVGHQRNGDFLSIVGLQSLPSSAQVARIVELFDDLGWHGACQQAKIEFAGQ